MKLNNDFSIRTDSNNFILVELVEGNKKVKGKLVPCKVEKLRYYGTLYQALQGFLRASVNRAEQLGDALKIASATIDTLDKMEKKIKEKFCTIVEKL